MEPEVSLSVSFHAPNEKCYKLGWVWVKHGLWQCQGCNLWHMVRAGKFVFQEIEPDTPGPEER